MNNKWSEARQFPFGAQYLRDLTPDRADWERDLAQMRQMNFNTLRAWLVWGVLEPREGEIDFAYLDEFAATADRHRLKAVYLFHLHGAPEWLVRKYPQYWYVAEDGRPFEPSARSNTPSGGWPGLCPDHASVQRLEEGFIGRVVDFLASHPSTAGFEPINEPHMWVDLGTEPHRTFCYCEQTRALFRQWLQRKYGTLEALERAWTKRLGCWDDVRPPTWRFGFADWADWRTFTTDNVTALVARRSEIIRRHTALPVIAHAWGGGSLLCPELGGMAFDDWKNSGPVDIWGTSAFPGKAEDTAAVSLSIAATESAAGGKPFWQAELGSGDYGSGFDRKGRVPTGLLLAWSWEAVRRGAKGLLYWQYRKALSGTEMGACGLTDYASGSTTANLLAAAEMARVIGRNEELFLEAKPVPAEIALVFSYQTWLCEWAQFRDNHLSMKSMNGYYKLLWDHHLPADVLHEEFFPADLGRYKLIILPLPAALSSATCRRLREYCAAGGMLLSDPYLAAFDDRKNVTSAMPGHGMDAVFGVREKDIFKAGDCERVRRCDNGATVEFRGGRYRSEWQVLSGPTAEVLAEYENGLPALVRNRYGNGTALIGGVDIGLHFALDTVLGDDLERNLSGEKGVSGRDWLIGLIRASGAVAPVDCAPEIRPGLLRRDTDGAVLLIATNMSAGTVTSPFRLSQPVASAVDLYAEREEECADGGFTAAFAPYQTRVWRLALS